MRATSSETVEDKLLEYNPEEAYFRYESGFYWDDDESSGSIFVTQKIVDKQNLEHVGIEQWYQDAPKFVEYQNQEAGYFAQMRTKYAQIINLSHITGYSETKNGERTQKTPHGNAKSDEFLAWFNKFPAELLQESEQEILVEGWHANRTQH